MPRLYRQVPVGSRYERSLEMLAYARSLRPEIPTKSGLMVGLGETGEEVLGVLQDLRASRVDIATIGQYLRPTTHHLPVREYVRPEAFAEYKRLGEEMGFLFVASGPFVRSSHNAIEFSRKVMADRLAAMEAAPAPAEAP